MSIRIHAQSWSLIWLNTQHVCCKEGDTPANSGGIIHDGIPNIETISRHLNNVMDLIVSSSQRCEVVSFIQPLTNMANSKKKIPFLKTYALLHIVDFSNFLI